MDVVAVAGVEVPALLQAVQPMARSVEVNDNFAGVFGQAACAHFQQQPFNLLRIVGQLVTAAVAVVGQFQTFERGGRRLHAGARCPADLVCRRR